MGKQVICYIQAYNSARTIESTMRSVREQTYQNWRCFVLCNGEDPKSRAFDIIRSYAAQDDRFVVLYRKKNWLGCYTIMLCQLAHMFPDAYICSLDADDEYEPDFFERAVALAEEQQLDIVASGTRLISRKYPGAPDGAELSRRALNENLIVWGEAFVQQFPQYRSFFNEVWGKLYRAELFAGRRGYKYDRQELRHYFLPDTILTFDMLAKCKKIGILSGTSHRFYQYEWRPASNGTAAVNEFAANQFATWRDMPLIRSFTGGYRYDVYHTYDKVMAFLRSHGEVSNEVYEYMQAVLFGWYGDIYKRTFEQLSSDAAMAKAVGKLVFHPKFDELMEYRDSGKYNNLRNYEAREAYCRRLYDLIACQPALCKRSTHFSQNMEPSLLTNRQFKRIMNKLEQTADKLSRLRMGG